MGLGPWAIHGDHPDTLTPNNAGSAANPWVRLDERLASILTKVDPAMRAVQLVPLMSTVKAAYCHIRTPPSRGSVALSEGTVATEVTATTWAVHTMGHTFQTSTEGEVVCREWASERPGHYL